MVRVLASSAEYLAWGSLTAALWLFLLQPRWLDRRVERWRNRRRPPGPDHRPVEVLVERARALSARYHHPAAGVRHAKQEGIRLAYDHTLGELCEALGGAHLLGVLPPGHELDVERNRVEQFLEAAGVHLGIVW